MKNLSKILFLFLFSLAISASNDTQGGIVEISRDYKINRNVYNPYILNGSVSFQACDAQMCVPMYQEISHTISEESSFISDNDIDIEVNPLIPDWGGLIINGFQSTDNPNQLTYSIQLG